MKQPRSFFLVILALFMQVTTSVYAQCGTVNAFTQQTASPDPGPGKSCWGYHFEIGSTHTGFTNPTFQWQWYNDTISTWIDHVNGVRWAQGSQTDHLSIHGSTMSPWRKTFLHRLVATSDNCPVVMDTATTIGLIMSPYSGLMFPTSNFCPGQEFLIWGEPADTGSNYMKPFRWWFDYQMDTTTVILVKDDTISKWSDTAIFIAPPPGVYVAHINFALECNTTSLINRWFWVDSCAIVCNSTLDVYCDTNKSCFGQHFEIGSTHTGFTNPVYQWQWYNDTTGTWINHTDGVRFVQGSQTDHLSINAGMSSPWIKTFLHRLVVTSDNCPATMDSTVTVGLVSSEVTHSMEPSDHLCPNDTVIIWGQLLETDSNYANPTRWWFTLSDTIVLKDDTTGAWSDTVLVVPNAPGVYQVQINMQTTCSSEKITQQFEVDSCLILSQGEGLVGNQISIYPNPANSWIRIDTDLDPVEVTIYTVYGKKLATWNILETENMLDIRTLRSGIYILRLNITSGRRITKKIVIQH